MHSSHLTLRGLTVYRSEMPNFSYTQPRYRQPYEDQQCNIKPTEKRPEMPTAQMAHLVFSTQKANAEKPKEPECSLTL